MLPLVLPPTVVGFGLLYLFGKNGIIGGILSDLFDFQVVFTWYAVILAAIVVSFPLIYQSVSAAFKQYNQNIENTAFIMVSSKWRYYWSISFLLDWQCF